jgi:protein disulfide-isomerase
MLHGDGGADEVKVEEAKARTRGADGVPFFVINNRVTISGAQPTAAFVAAFQQVAPAESGQTCGVGSGSC